MLTQNLEFNEPKRQISTSNSLESEYWKNAELLFASKEFFLAKSIYAKLHEMQPHKAIILRRLAICFDKIGEKENAKTSYQQACNLDPSFENLVEAGNFFYECRDFSTAKKYFLKSICHQEEDYQHIFEMFKNLGNIAVHEADYDQALEYYNKAHRIFDGSDILMVNYGSLYFQSGKFERSFESYREAISINPKSDSAYLGLAILHRQQGDFEMAWGNIQKALDCSPMNKFLLQVSAQWALADFRYSFAIEALECFIENNEFDAEINVLLACLLFQAGHRELCYWECQKILAFEPTNEDAEKLMQLLLEEKKD